MKNWKIAGKQWAVVGGNVREFVSIETDDGIVALVYDPQNRGRAKLIETTPKLLEACDRLIFALTIFASGMTPDLPGTLDFAYSAIAKARGENEEENDDE